MASPASVRGRGRVATQLGYLQARRAAAAGAVLSCSVYCHIGLGHFGCQFRPTFRGTSLFYRATMSYQPASSCCHMAETVNSCRHNPVGHRQGAAQARVSLRERKPREHEMHFKPRGTRSIQARMAEVSNRNDPYLVTEVEIPPVGIQTSAAPLVKSRLGRPRSISGLEA
ncbi:hypothetical protein Micbo1qcDRAFT_11574 [Microdochium bolleyi]|uniref:Uncharacterized protein n=1 Tax=Microdochium bolleyi TaxID=196109 RepID=A0A136IID5_9PEZI|nr:hypothetical protein Micbo1qcDRAFT_11574 [Microdochium bolleyi]